MTDARTEKSFSEGYFLNAGNLFATARSACERMGLAGEKADLRDALIAVVFSAAALEAFIMEVPIILRPFTLRAKRNPVLARLDSLLSECEESRASIQLKFIAARAVLGAEPYDKGAQPYQDFRLLFSLRDSLIHMKPDKIRDEPNRILQALRSRGVLDDSEPNVKTSFLGDVATRKVGRWAVDVAADMVQSIRDCFSPNQFGDAVPLVVGMICGSFERL